MPQESLVATDPRDRTDGLGWVTRAVFDDPRLRLTVSIGMLSRPLLRRGALDHAEGAGQGDAAARYAVVPSLDRARFLLPLGSHRVTAASVLAYNALRPPRVRASRAVIGLLARVGALGVTRAPILSVHAPDGVELLWDHLAGLLGEPRLHAAIGIRPPDPHHKPTLQLFDDAGRPCGYAKIGWNDGTRAMVRAEAAALVALPPPGDGMPAAPRLLRHTRWHDREVAVVEPMPRDVRRLRHPDRPLLAAMLAVARRGGPPAPPRPVGPFLAACRRRAAPAIEPAIDVLAARDGEVQLEFGDWHGDWVPWNMARRRDDLIVWDWENHGSGVPVGFDLAHQAFQTALSTHGRPAAECATAVDAALAEHGAALGLSAAARRFVADAYLVELWLRTYELSADGAGWNPKLHPALLHVLDARLRAR